MVELSLITPRIFLTTSTDLARQTHPFLRPGGNFRVQTLPPKFSRNGTNSGGIPWSRDCEITMFGVALERSADGIGRRIDPSPSMNPAMYCIVHTSHGLVTHECSVIWGFFGKNFFAFDLLASTGGR